MFVHFAGFILGYTFVKAFVAEFSIGDLQAPVPTKNLNVFYRLKINWFTIFEPCDCRWWYTSGWAVNIQIVVKNNRKFSFRHRIWANFRRHWKIKFKVKCSKLKKKKKIWSLYSNYNVLKIMIINTEIFEWFTIF